MNSYKNSYSSGEVQLVSWVTEAKSDT